MYFYQIITSIFSEFCFINLFFIGLVYSAFFQQELSSEPGNFFKKNLLNLFLLIYLYILLFITLYCSSSFSESFSFVHNFISLNLSNNLTDLIILFLSFLILLSILNYLTNLSTTNLDVLLMYGLLVSCFLLIIKFSNLFVIVMCLEVSLVIFYSILMYLENLKNINVLEAFTKFFFTASLSSILLLLGVLYAYKALGTCSLLEMNLFFNDYLIQTKSIFAYDDWFFRFLTSINMRGYSFLENFSQFNTILSQDLLSFNNITLIFSILFFSCGMFFKFAAVPFHSWSPDVYHVLPSNLIILMSTLPKLIYGFILFKLFIFSLAEFSDFWILLLTIIAFISLTYSVVLILELDNIRRFVAYSSIPQIALIFIIILFNEPFYTSYAFVYFLIYLVSLHFFLMLLSFTQPLPHFFSKLTQFFLYNPVILWLFLVSLLQLAGIPPLPIFTLKLYVLNFLFANGSFILYFFVLLGSCVSIFYYVKIFKIISFDILNLKLLDKNITNYAVDFNFFKMISFFILLYLQLMFIFCSDYYLQTSFYYLNILNLI